MADSGRAGRFRWTIGLGMLVLAAGCGDDDDGGPVTGDVAGVWTYEISDASGNGASCDVTNVDLEFTSTGSGYEGTWTAGGNGNIQCTFSGGGTQTLNFGPDVGEIEILEASDTEMDFVFNTSSGDWRSTGRFEDGGNVMTGDVTIFLASGSSLVQLDGTWRAERD